MQSRSDTAWWLDQPMTSSDYIYHVLWVNAKARKGSFRAQFERMKTRENVPTIDIAPLRYHHRHQQFKASSLFAYLKIEKILFERGDNHRGCSRQKPNEYGARSLTQSQITLYWLRPLNQHQLRANSLYAFRQRRQSLRARSIKHQAR